MKLRDMTPEQQLEWGRGEHAARKTDLEVRTPEGLRTAQVNAEHRRKLIGATKGQAADLVLAASREARRNGERA